jgi:uncharacterized damage-inducible protein DinB
MKALLVNYTQFNVWANERIIAFLKDNVSEEQLDKEIISSFPSLRKTLYHIWDAEGIWHARLNGSSPVFGLSKRFNGSTEESYQALLANSKAFADLIASKDEKYFQETLHYANTKGVKFENRICDIVQHCMNHSSYHRGQIITMLRQLGFTDLFETDYIAYCRLTPAVSAS